MNIMQWEAMTLGFRKSIGREDIIVHSSSSNPFQSSSLLSSSSLSHRNRRQLNFFWHKSMAQSDPIGSYSTCSTSNVHFIQNQYKSFRSSWSFEKEKLALFSNNKNKTMTPICHHRHFTSWPNQDDPEINKASHPSLKRTGMITHRFQASRINSQFTPMIFNSLTGQKESLKCHLPDKFLSWYSCGPTVYDDAHLGHARNYMSLDIIQRILTDYFNYNIVHVMGMTDVDDKIIQRSIESSRSPIELAREFEQRFLMDMHDLNIRPPTISCRVTEHIPEIISYIEKIIQNGFAYQVANGSIYFNVEKLGNQYGKLGDAGGSKESKKRATIDDGSEGQIENMFSQGDSNLLEDGETNLKQHHRDFALWKGRSTTMSTERDGGNGWLDSLTWKSPWCKLGRPGWHIECSAMSEQYLGSRFDVHWGGIDLKFPHHNNEIAQSDACHYHDDPNYCHAQSGREGEVKKLERISFFVHSGHLHIDGMKMSKSLKNFVTVKYFLQQRRNYNDDDGGIHGSADELRMCFLNVGYGSNMELSQDRIIDARNQLWRFRELFQVIRTHELKVKLGQNLLKQVGTSINTWTQHEYELFNHLEDIKEYIHICLCDNFNTSKAIKHLLDLVRWTNSYIEQVNKRNERRGCYCTLILNRVTNYLYKMLSIFGLRLAIIEQSKDISTWSDQRSQQGQPSINEDDTNSQNQDNLNGNGPKAKLKMEKMLHILLEYRAKVRHLLLERKNLALKEEGNQEQGTTLSSIQSIRDQIFLMSDEIRDSQLPQLGIQLTDLPDRSYHVEFLDQQQIEMCREIKHPKPKRP